MRKLSLGPAVPATCRSCGRSIGVPWLSMVTLIPFIAGAGTAMYLQTSLSLALPVAGMIAMFFLWRYVPLVRR
jgi:hypothetical protein